MRVITLNQPSESWYHTNHSSFRETDSLKSKHRRHRVEKEQILELGVFLLHYAKYDIVLELQTKANNSF